MTNNAGGIQNVGILKNLTSNVPATFLPQSMPSNEVKGSDAIPDKSGKKKEFESCWKKNSVSAKE